MVRERPGYFARWHEARRRLAWVREQVAAGRTVYLCTYLKATKITAKTLALVSASPSGFYVQHGKSRVCYDGCALRAE